MALPALTDQQQAVLDFLGEFTARNGFPPTLREIGRAVGVANVSAVRGHVGALEKKGYLARSPDKARAIHLLTAPSLLSRVKRKLHEVFRTDDGVVHQVCYGLAWATAGRQPLLAGPAAKQAHLELDRQAIEHGWTILDRRIAPDHVVAVVQTWPTQSADQTVRRMRASLARVLRRTGGPGGGDERPWARGFVATTDLTMLDDLVGHYLESL